MAVADRPRVSRAGAGRELGAGLLGGIVLLVLTPSDAFAYIDPGSGALIWQAALSAFFGALFLARRALLRLFRGLSRGGRAEGELAETPVSTNDRTERSGSGG
jgi:hypothetical protein